MEDSNVFIIGAKGQLGLALQAQYPSARSADIDELDITNKQSVEAFDWSGITVILNAAGYTNVDGAETAEGRTTAWMVNADAVGNLVSVAAQKGITLVHISSDYVFDGSHSPHTEYEPFSPLSSYGASKAAGDLLVSLCPKFYIVRTSWVIGEGKNFVRTMLELGQKNVNPSVVADQVGRLTFTPELVRSIQHLLTIKAEYGTYNVSGGGEPASWAQIARTIFEVSNLDLQVTDTTTADYFSSKHGVAVRPLQSTLDLSKIESTGFVPQDWKDGLKQYIKGGVT